MWCFESVMQRLSSQRSDDTHLPHLDDDDENYDVIAEDGGGGADVIDVTQRTLPPLPTNNNHDGYTRLNHTASNDSILAYNNYVVDKDSESSSYQDPAILHSATSPYQRPTISDGAGPQPENGIEVVEDSGSSTRTNVGVVFPIQRMDEPQDDGLDAKGYLELIHVPSTEDLSKVDEVAEVKSGESERRQADDGLDRHGYLILHHVSTPKPDRKAASGTASQNPDQPSRVPN